MTNQTDLSYPKDNIKVLLLEGIHPTAEENFKKHNFINVETYSEAWSEEQLLEHIADVQLIGIRSKTNITKKVLEHAVADMTKLTGQKPIINNARKSVAGFKIREGWPIGCKVTLRSERMYEFLDRLISIAIPRIRDFRGLNPKSFDGRGNYSMGVREQIIFPEIDYDKIDTLRGMDITITTSAKTDDEARALLKAFSFPFKG